MFSPFMKSTHLFGMTSINLFKSALVKTVIYSLGIFLVLLFFLLIQPQENKEELKQRLKEMIREKSDAFNSENPEEDKVYFNSLLLV